MPLEPKPLAPVLAPLPPVWPPEPREPLAGAGLGDGDAPGRMFGTEGSGRGVGSTPAGFKGVGEGSRPATGAVSTSRAAPAAPISELNRSLWRGAADAGPAASARTAASGWT